MLQSHFNSVVFSDEMKLYALEGVECTTVDFIDNYGIILKIKNAFKVSSLMHGIFNFQLFEVLLL